jgi:hypothetical protein
MARVDEPKSAEANDQETGADLDLPLPFDQDDQQPEGTDYHEHRQQMTS